MAIGGCCSICGRETTDAEFRIGFPPFITDRAHPLWKFSDSTMHYSCLSNWKERQLFLEEWFDFLSKPAYVTASVIGPTSALHVSNNVYISSRGDILVRGFAPRLLVKTASDFDKFANWLAAAKHESQLTILSKAQDPVSLTLAKTGDVSQLKIYLDGQHHRDYVWELNQEQLLELSTAVRRASEKLNIEEQARSNRQRCRKDAIVLGLIAIGFLALGIGAQVLSSYEDYQGTGFKPLEVMSIFAFTATCVLGLWSFRKLLRS
jgi:hypothetical protein